MARRSSIRRGEPTASPREAGPGIGEELYRALGFASRLTNAEAVDARHRCDRNPLLLAFDEEEADLSIQVGSPSKALTDTSSSMSGQ
jgi:hypothetical protein